MNKDDLKITKIPNRFTYTLLVTEVYQFQMSLVTLDIFIVRYIQNIVKIVLKSVIKDCTTFLTIVSILFFKRKKHIFKCDLQMIFEFN